MRCFICTRQCQPPTFETEDGRRLTRGRESRCSGRSGALGRLPGRRPPIQNNTSVAASTRKSNICARPLHLQLPSLRVFFSKARNPKFAHVNLPILLIHIVRRLCDVVLDKEGVIKQVLFIFRMTKTRRNIGLTTCASVMRAARTSYRQAS